MQYSQHSAPMGLHNVEPFYGWLGLYNHEEDERSPFHGVEHNLFEYDRYIYTFPAHPTWDTIESESLLVKILFVDYERGYAIIELLGEWNDLQYNDFKLLCEGCLSYLVDQGINRFALICENVFNVYLGPDDYYEAFQDELEDGWLCLLRARAGVKQEFCHFGLDQYVFFSEELDAIKWRKLRPWQLYDLLQKHIERPLLGM